MIPFYWTRKKVSPEETSNNPTPRETDIMEKTSTKTIAKVLFAAPDGQYSPKNIARLRKEGNDITICHNAKAVLTYFNSEEGKPHLALINDVLPHGDEFNDMVTLRESATGRALYVRLNRTHECRNVIFAVTTENVDEVGEIVKLKEPNLLILHIKPGELDYALNTVIKQLLPAEVEPGKEETSM